MPVVPSTHSNLQTSKSKRLHFLFVFVLSRKNPVRSLDAALLMKIESDESAPKSQTSSFSSSVVKTEQKSESKTDDTMSDVEDGEDADAKLKRKEEKRKIKKEVCRSYLCHFKSVLGMFGFKRERTCRASNCEAVTHSYHKQRRDDAQQCASNNVDCSDFSGFSVCVCLCGSKEKRQHFFMLLVRFFLPPDLSAHQATSAISTSTIVNLQHDRQHDGCNIFAEKKFFSTSEKKGFFYSF